ncbi:MAG: SCO6880 family protein, partial [Solirubrobacteraceae bacterium]
MASAEEQRQTFRLGPRSTRGLFGYITATQAIAAGVGAVIAVGLLAGSQSVLVLVVAIAVALTGVAVAFWPVANRTVAQWAPVHLAYAVRVLAGAVRWSSPAVGRGVTVDEHGQLRYPVALPAPLQGVEIISVRRPSGEVGLLFDRAEQTICAVLQIRLRAFGLLSDRDQARRLAAFGELQNDLARDGSPVRRIMLLKRTVPRKTNELVTYLKEHCSRLDSPSVRAMFEVIDQSAELSREHEVFFVVQMPAVAMSRSARRRMSGIEQRQHAAAEAADQLQEIARHLEADEIAIRSVDGALTPRALARMVKDSFDPFGRLLRDRRDLVEPEAAGLHAAHAWPVCTHDFRDRYRADSADHLVWHIQEWPKVPVAAGFMQPLTLRPDLPVHTIAIVMEPVGTQRAMREAERRRVSDEASAQTRAKMRQIETSEHRARAEQGDREEREIAAGLSSWRWEAYIAASVPAGDEDQ